MDQDFAFGMVMFVVFLLCDFITVVAYGMVYSDLIKYQKGMLFGVHIPKEQVEHENVTELKEKFVQKWKLFYRWNLIVGMLLCGICFFQFSIFMLIWSVWLAEFILLGTYLINGTHKKMYEIKIQNQWMSEPTEKEEDQDEYWIKGWYCNPNDKRVWVKDRMCSTNYSMNMAKPEAKAGAVFMAAFLIGSLLFIVVLLWKFDHTEIAMQVEKDVVTIDAAIYDTEFLLEDIQSVELLEQIPEDDFIRTNGGATQDYLIGHFRGDVTGDCMMYLYRDYSPIIKIVLEDQTIFINSKSKEEVENWFQILNK